MNAFSILLYTSYYTPPEKDDNTGLLIAFFFFLPFIIALTYFYFNIYLKGKHKKVVFDQHLPYNDDNLLEAYILLSAHILKSDRGFSKDKLYYIHKYFKQHFPKSYYNFRETLSEAYKNPIMINSITSWIKAFMRSKKDRTQIIYFLAGICIIDGRFSSLEIQRLKEIALKIKLTEKEFESILAMYKSNYRASQEAKSEYRQSQRKTRSSSSSSRDSKSYKHSSSSSRPRETKKSTNCKILGVSESASMSEIKKAYRKLVKIHHPDRFHNSSEEQKNIAKAKFISIQKAYEYLEIIYK